MSLFHKLALAGAIGAIPAMFILGALRQLLLSQRLIQGKEAGPAMKVAVFGLFLVFVYSLIPLILHLFIIGQGKIGNETVGMVRLIHDHEHGVTYAVWSLFTAGLLVALPFMWTDFFGFKKPIGKSQGVISTNIGLTLADTVARSTFKVSPGFTEKLTGSTMSTSQGVFDLEIAGTGTRFLNCRYCAIDTGPNGDPNIVHINVGLSARKLPRPAFTQETESILKQLRTEGWSSGHFERTDPDEIRANGNTRFGDGDYWRIGNTLLRISEKRMDDAKPGEDAATAGEFIHVIDLLRQDDPGYKNLVFENSAVAQK